MDVNVHFNATHSFSFSDHSQQSRPHQGLPQFHFILHKKEQKSSREGYLWDISHLHELFACALMSPLRIKFDKTGNASLIVFTNWERLIFHERFYLKSLLYCTLLKCPWNTESMNNIPVTRPIHWIELYFYHTLKLMMATKNINSFDIKIQGNWIKLKCIRLCLARV